MVSAPETKFRISKALSIRIKIIPIEMIIEANKNRAAMLIVNVSAKNRGVKKNNNWVGEAEVRVLGYGTPAKITNPKAAQKIKAKITLGRSFINIF